MQDQADQLRQLVSHAAAGGLSSATAAPLIVVAGGKGGVGATTVAVNLAVALAQHGERTVLVDANLHQPDATALCQLQEMETITDVLTGRRTVHEVLKRGPAGIQVLPGHWAPANATECSPAAQHRLLAALGRLGAHADAIIVDAGSGMNEVTERFALASDLLLLVTTPDSLSVMDTYAAMKVLANDQSALTVWTVVNQAAKPKVDSQVHSRIQQASQRFLGCQIEEAATIPTDEKVAEAYRQGQPVVLEAPRSAAAKRIARLADQVAQFVESGDRRRLVPAG